MITYILVPMYATWDFTKSYASQLKSFNFMTEGIYKDFNSNWFLDVGQTVYGVMIFNMFMPVIEFGIFWAIRYIRRLWDQG